MNDKQVDGTAIKELLERRDWVVEQLGRADKQARSFLTEHPILSLACAVGVGYLAARLMRSSK
jgi:ElaB/YqjD/DUF883 family membrane-anchored ribosome-binding protein